MGGDVAAGQDAAVHFRVQGFHTAVQDLRETGHLTDADGFDTLFLEEFLGSPGGDDLPTEVHEALDEVNQAGLVANAYECSHFISFAIVSIYSACSIFWPMRCTSAGSFPS